ncbi:MAG: TraR/DksA C4-type zinc finger protein [Candidatus Pacebacteria bacterium]|nr:TraR/DksA C4-type zinc finger protein [Candidatus Paceibacterota bacterium]
MEELGTNSAIVEELEARYKNVLHALQKIEEGTFGMCEVGGEEIAEDRLMANPAARTCVAHA